METMARARTHRRLGRGLVEAALGEVAASGFRETLEVLGRAFPLTLCAALAAFGAAAGPAAAADTWYASPGGSGGACTSGAPCSIHTALDGPSAKAANGDTIMLLRCTRYVAVKPSLKRAVAAGATAVPFSGRIGTRALKPGSYRLTVVVADAAGNRSNPRSIGFRVVRR